MFKRTFILFLIFLGVSLYGDCSHCYDVAQVKIVFKNGRSITGYMPVFGGYGCSEKIKVGDDLKIKCALKNTESINFMKNIFKFPRIGYVAAKEEIRKIKLAVIDKIIFLSWIRGFSGASEIASLPKNLIKKILKSGIVCIATVPGSVSDDIFINLNPNIKEEDLKFFLKYSFRGDYIPDKFYYFYNLVGFPENYKRSYKKELNTTEVIKLLKDVLKTEKKYAEEISEKLSNSSFKIYLFSVRAKYIKRIKLYYSLLDYLRYEDITGIKNFVEYDVDNKATKAKAREIIPEMVAKNDLKTLSKFLHAIYGEISFGKREEDLFQKTVKENNIIIFTVYWD